MTRKNNMPLVFSYPRSGTHWFCSLLHHWFFPEHTAETEEGLASDLEFHGIGETGKDKIKRVPWMRLFGGHYYNPYLTSTWRRINAIKTIYLLRDGKDVMVSIWKLDQHIAKENNLECVSLSYYLRNNIHLPSNFPADNSIPNIKSGICLPILWWWSTILWRTIPGIFIVRYEDLLIDECRNRVRDDLSSYLDIPYNREKFTDKPIGFLPGNMSKRIRWNLYFDTSDLDFWYDCRYAALSIIKENNK